MNPSDEATLEQTVNDVAPAVAALIARVASADRPSRPARFGFAAR